MSILPSEKLTLEYGGVATRWGVVCDRRDDGVTIALPATLASSMNGAEHPLIAVAQMSIHLGAERWGKPLPPRVVLELNRDEFRIHESMRGGHKTVVRSWPRHEVAELRANRYSKGLLVRIPGKDNFDMLADCSAPLIQWIGEELTAAMERTRPASAS